MHADRRSVDHDVNEHRFSLRPIDELAADRLREPLRPGVQLCGLRRLRGRVAQQDRRLSALAQAGGHGLLGLRARWTQVLPAGRLELQARIDNLANRAVAGSVIVSDANGRFFEPAPPRNALLSLRWAVAWP